MQIEYAIKATVARVWWAFTEDERAVYTRELDKETGFPELVVSYDDGE